MPTRDALLPLSLGCAGGWVPESRLRPVALGPGALVLVGGPVYLASCLEIFSGTRSVSMWLDPPLQGPDLHPTGQRV